MYFFFIHPLLKFTTYLLISPENNIFSLTYCAWIMRIKYRLSSDIKLWMFDGMPQM